jgi:hypothetical protein
MVQEFMQNKHKVSYATMVLEPIPKGEPSQMLTEQTLRDFARWRRNLCEPTRPIARYHTTLWRLYQ